jgi:hypothetical protein
MAVVCSYVSCGGYSGVFCCRWSHRVQLLELDFFIPIFIHFDRGARVLPVPTPPRSNFAARLDWGEEGYERCRGVQCRVEKRKSHRALGRQCHRSSGRFRRKIKHVAHSRRPYLPTAIATQKKPDDVRSQVLPKSCFVKWHLAPRRGTKSGPIERKHSVGGRA